MRFCEGRSALLVLVVGAMGVWGCDQSTRTSLDAVVSNGADVPRLEPKRQLARLFSEALPDTSSASKEHATGPAEPLIKRQRKKSQQLRESSGRRVQTVYAATPETRDAFRSPSDCRELLERGERAPRQPGSARIASWNVRWFPDGVPGSPSSTNGATDLDWMACVIAWMNVDALALAEIKSKPLSTTAFERITAWLSVFTDATYVVRMDDCPDQNGQHVAWLVNEQKVKVSDWQMHGSLNPNGDACAGQLRPGLGGQFHFAGGLDLHAIVVHFKSGVEPSDLEKRRTSFDALERVLAAVTVKSGDSDALVVGDFNTMGCRTCSDVSRSSAETSWLDTRLRSYRPEARRVPNDLGCSYYYQRQPSLLDHFIVTSAMREAPVAVRANVLGHCREFACEAYSGKDPEAAAHLSDHCPIVLELRDQDLD